MIGKTLGHYQITEELGHGGMGTVYRARDTKLDRDVALKVLPPEMASDPERRGRFLREAKAVAALQHPNIVTMYSVDEDQGTLFLTMELIEGATLDAVIPTHGLRLGPLLELAIPFADAVSYAHTKGITHRDLKPTNLMIDERKHVRVLDFGLVKLLEPVNPGLEGATITVDQEKTAEGRILGTAAYMSPEQAQGLPVDPRSDIFSMGVLLYEMATGRRPFHGDTHISTISAVLKDEPQPVTQINASLPRHLSRIIQKCLAKDAGRRYQTAADLKIDLEGLKEESESGMSELNVGAEMQPSDSGSVAGRAGMAGVAGVAPSGMGTPDSSLSGMGAPATHASSPGVTPVTPASESGLAAPASGGMPRWVLPLVGVVVVVGALVMWQLTRGGGDTAVSESSPSSPVTAASSTPTPPVSAAVARTMIAVLPFANLGPAEDAYFAEGITDEITSRLAGVASLGVISRMSTAKYAGSDKTASEIGAELGVEYLVHGSVRWEKSGDGKGRVRVTPQLVRADNDTQIWSDRYDESVEAIFDVQERIAESVVSEMSSALGTGAIVLAEQAGGTRNLEAYRLYLQAERMGKNTYGDVSEVIALLEQAVAIDPQFADAWSHLSMMHSLAVHNRLDTSEENLARARETAEIALALPGGGAAGHFALGTYYYWGRKQYDRAYAEFEKTGYLDSDAETMVAAAYTLRRKGELHRALELQEHALVLDPRNSAAWRELGFTYGSLHRWDDMERAFTRAITEAPEDLFLYFIRGWSRVSIAGDMTELEASLNASPSPQSPMFAVGWVFIRLAEGDPEGALPFAKQVTNVVTDDLFLPASFLEYFCLRQAGDSGAEVASNAARKELEDAVAASPSDWTRRIALARYLALAGDGPAAVREARTACDLMPVNADALNGRVALAQAATVEIAAGEVDRGVEILTGLLAEDPPGVALGYLRVDFMLQDHLDHPQVRSLLYPTP